MPKHEKKPKPERGSNRCAVWEILESPATDFARAPIRAALIALLLLGGLSSRAAPAPVATLERVSLLGREYVRLTDWAREHEFRVVWLSPEECQLSNRWARLRFTVNTSRILLNGVAVWISSPIALHHGVAHIAPVDLNTAVHPVLFPPKNRSGSRLRTICLDPGHGGKDTGNREGREQEKELTLALARELRSQLGQAGFKVVLTRSTDAYPELEDRPALARRRGADLFLSLHFNAAEGAEANGAEVYCLTPAKTSSTNARGEGASGGAYWGNLNNAQNVLLAFHVQHALVQKLGLEDRGVRRARFAVLRAATMPAVLIEGGFMSHPAEARKMYDSAWRRQLAQAIVSGVQAYRRQVEAR